tara:strand:- start:990 stop:1757 length:768 start_codon:yes stop_codon:yes gene_type:complete
MAITTGGTVTLTAGSLPSNFCHTSWQSTLNNFVSATSVSFNGGALFTAGSSTPSPSDENKLWCKMNAGNTDVLGWYYHDGDSWEAVPVPVASALPTSGASAGTYGDADKHVGVTVDIYGRITAVEEITPTAVASDGLAKAWAKFQGSTGSVVNSYNCSVNRTGSGQYTVTTSGTTFASSPIVVASHTGFEHGTGSTQSFTVSPAVRVTTSVSGGDGIATVVVERSQHDGEDATDGDENWDAEYADTDVCLVFFGS